MEEDLKFVEFMAENEFTVVMQHVTKRMEELWGYTTTDEILRDRIKKYLDG